MEVLPLKEISEMLRKKRKKLDIKQKKIASVAGLSPSQVNRIENNTVNPSYDAVHSLWEALDSLEDKNVETAEDLMNDPITWAYTDDTVEEVKVKMRENSFSQLPVSYWESEIRHTGRITRDDLIDVSDPDQTVKDLLVENDLMGKKFLEIPYTLNKDAVKEILKEDSAVLVHDENEKLKGIITKSDLI